MLQHVAPEQIRCKDSVCCSVLRCKDSEESLQRFGVLQCVAICCCALEYVAVYTYLTHRIHTLCAREHCVALYCSVLQRVAACCSVLQRVAACCSALHCVIVCT